VPSRQLSAVSHRTLRLSPVDDHLPNPLSDTHTSTSCDRCDDERAEARALRKVRREQRRLRLLEERFAGKSFSQVAEILGIKASSAQKWFRRVCFEIAERGPPDHPYYEQACAVRDAHRERTFQPDPENAYTSRQDAEYLGFLALKHLSQNGRWAEYGFFEWLFGWWDQVSLADSTITYARCWSWSDIQEKLSSTGTDENTAVELLRPLEDMGVLWIVNRGSEILCLELRELAP